MTSYLTCDAVFILHILSNRLSNMQVSQILRGLFVFYLNENSGAGISKIIEDTM